MHAITFDTLEFTEQLKAAGVPEEQAKGHLKALTAVMRQMAARLDEWADKHDKQAEARLEGLATKQDIEVRIKEVEAKIKEVELKLAETKAEIIKWVLGVATTQTMLIVALIKLLPGGH
ncbi:MAG: DUF1640 domain-containing protein [Magnetococcales bacterium]|nr:DUF1640 domain-containing protein [Magnetococcales bacterium]